MSDENINQNEAKDEALSQEDLKKVAGGLNGPGGAGLGEAGAAIGEAV